MNNTMSQITNTKNVTQREGWNHHEMYVVCVWSVEVIDGWANQEQRIKRKMMKTQGQQREGATYEKREGGLPSLLSDHRKTTKQKNIKQTQEKQVLQPHLKDGLSR